MQFKGCCGRIGATVQFCHSNGGGIDFTRLRVLHNCVYCVTLFGGGNKRIIYFRSGKESVAIYLNRKL